MHRFQQLPERFTISGPTIGLSERAYGAFALLLHEMMTNAAKYGCLSQPGGALSVEWRLSDEGDCVLDWNETGGPLVSEPTRKGFGTSLIHRTISSDLDGNVQLNFFPTGLCGRFTIPSSHLHEVAPSSPVKQKQAARETTLSGMTVLLVEDQSLIAMDVEEMLRELSCDEVMTAPTVSHANRLIGELTPDLAILDFNLGHETTEAVADELVRRSIPFVFATGYRDGTGIPKKFESVPVVNKPMSRASLSETLALVIGRFEQPSVGGNLLPGTIWELD
jgi:CheY-like chemotaxis protein